MSALYLNGADPRSPLAAPIYADLRGIAPLYIQVGAAETLLDDAIRLARVAGAADVPVTLEIWPEMVHVWHLFHPRPRPHAPRWYEPSKTLTPGFGGEGRVRGGLSSFPGCAPSARCGLCLPTSSPA